MVKHICVLLYIVDNLVSLRARLTELLIITLFAYLLQHCRYL